MSRLAKKPITIPENVEINQKESLLTIKGIKGVLHQSLHSSVLVKIERDLLQVVRKDDSKIARSIQGTLYVLIKNHIRGVTEGFTKRLQLHGVGYKAKIVGDRLELNLGKSHLVEYMVPKEIKIEIPSVTEIIVSGINKQLVGQVAANIRRFKEPEPYKGKGVRYLDEVIVLKETKSSKK